ncbi:trypsin-like serine protease [Nocardioides zeae]|uniref:Trypsin-like serine protease n=1 Tax=Nocardioides zeae TaxID=1457234 RepID=A0A6P0HGM1_9ACTN|nr:trypsin-like serine protease [Nocardioides zeae]NEN77437.1 trypsin-like serine protease [Nocardioides zeae]
MGLNEYLNTDAEYEALGEEEFDRRSQLLLEALDIVGVSTITDGTGSQPIPRGFAGSSFDQTEMTLRLFWVDKAAPEEALAKIAAELPEVKVEISDAKNDRPTLESIINSFPYEKYPAITGLAHRRDGSAVVVRYEGTVDGPAVARELGTDIILVDDTGAPGLVPLDNRHTDAPPLNGGASFRFGGEPVGFMHCSTGYAVRNTSSGGVVRFRMMTAAHCVTGAGERDTAYQSDGNLGLYPGTNSGNTTPFSDYDIATMATGHNLTHWIFRGGIFSQSEKAVSGAFSGTVVGMGVATNGAQSGEHIGSIVARENVPPGNRSACTETCWITFVQGNTSTHGMATHGDSGGPLIIQDDDRLYVGGLISVASDAQGTVPCDTHNDGWAGNCYRRVGIISHQDLIARLNEFTPGWSL